uniref:Glycosyltransferase family 92 protein n=1 Tax=Chromera velia CCMP2878 TaxID=1169474 RepID=A0A0G4IDL9_9ALVE|eukprot:Cvel_13323.t1-p1 / transcript=Cvel_13323.t1 / gene=Cvel_13323 / organism=Chromera_velia_CCMP2878 / gene_product=hypothetical protein / transcript_product=hypothetical protein / location=Cvel_scaffold904:34737-38139(+) / protein_length=623 / sequence_SO=supercontig / SO=protein_coding / is_pseudo=false
MKDFESPGGDGDGDGMSCPGPSIGLACTFSLYGRSAEPFVSFVLYHAKVGVDVFFLFMDTPEKDKKVLEAVDRLRGQLSRLFPAQKKSLHVFERSPALFALYEELKLSSLRQHAHTFSSEVVSRQMVNAEFAVLKALEQGLDWILHIDMDELVGVGLPPPEREGGDGDVCSLKTYLGRLEAEGIDQVTWPNHEAVPLFLDTETETGRETEDYFQSSYVFKRNPFCVPFSEAAERAMRFWKSRTRHQQFLLFYDNGKSAARVVPGLRPKSVHAWTRLEGSPLRSVTCLADPRVCLSVSGEEGGVVLRRGPSPFVLHFPVGGIGWIRSKYRQLGEYRDTWLGGSLRIAPSFHLDAWGATLLDEGGELVGEQKEGGGPEGGAEGKGRGEERTALRDLFEHEALFPQTGSADLLKAHEEAGVLLTFRDHLGIISDTRRAAGFAFVESSSERPRACLDPQQHSGAVPLHKKEKEEEAVPLHKEEKEEEDRGAGSLREVEGEDQTKGVDTGASRTSTGCTHTDGLRERDLQTELCETRTGAQRGIEKEKKTRGDSETTNGNEEHQPGHHKRDVQSSIENPNVVAAKEENTQRTEEKKDKEKGDQEKAKSLEPDVGTKIRLLSHVLRDFL